MLCPGRHLRRRHDVEPRPHDMASLFERALGGRGGPYRLWDGKHVPHQVSDEAKAEELHREAQKKERDVMRLMTNR